MTFMKVGFREEVPYLTAFILMQLGVTKDMASQCLKAYSNTALQGATVCVVHALKNLSSATKRIHLWHQCTFKMSSVTIEVSVISYCVCCD